MVLDGSDNFATRFLVNDACFFAKKTLISASMFRFEGQLTTIKPHAGYPCYRCLYPEPPPAGLVPNCQEAGVLGALAGTMGILQASEAIKEILGIGETLADRLLIYDALEMKFRKVSRPKDPACPPLRARIRRSQISVWTIPSAAPSNYRGGSHHPSIDPGQYGGPRQGTRSLRVLRAPGWNQRGRHPCLSDQEYRGTRRS